MTLKIIEDDGTEMAVNDVIAYDCLTGEDIDLVLEQTGIKLSESQRECVARYCRNLESFPNMDDLRDIVHIVSKEEC